MIPSLLIRDFYVSGVWTEAGIDGAAEKLFLKLSDGKGWVQGQDPVTGQPVVDRLED